MPNASSSTAPANSAAPFGYTKAGKPRKRPASDKEGFCPVKRCKKSFRHRPDPKKAVWQHLNYYFRENIFDQDGEMAQLHRTAHAEKKKEEAAKHLTEEKKKQHRKEASKRYAKKNPAKKKTSSALANFRVKAKRHLKKEGKEISEEVVDQMAEAWMQEKISEEITEDNLIIISD